MASGVGSPGALAASVPHVCREKNSFFLSLESGEWKVYVS